MGYYYVPTTFDFPCDRIKLIRMHTYIVLALHLNIMVFTLAQQIWNFLFTNFSKNLIQLTEPIQIGPNFDFQPFS